MISLKEVYFSVTEQSEEDYRGLHQAPDSTNGAPLHDLSTIYPDDIYTSPQASRFYGTSEPWDSESISIIQSAHNKPNMSVKIYRAIPKNLDSKDRLNDLVKQQKYILKYGKVPTNIDTVLNKSDYYAQIGDEIEKLKSAPPVINPESNQINKGDWVSIVKRYAIQHGKSQLNDQYKILTKVVKAKDIYTDGNSIHEWGYDPK